ncbi:MAG TPA: hypothetical protein VMZ50_08430 [Phycisphaerae bacterium]|nr:hypothetical protein [Phycisphaerae bacterium]
MKAGDLVKTTLKGVTREKMEVVAVPGDGTVVLRYCRGYAARALREDGTPRRGGTKMWLAYGWRVVQTAEERLATELMA